MLKPDMPNMAGMPSMNDAFDFMKKMWSGMNMLGTSMPGMPNMSGMPGMVMPTFSVEEINKQIADLKAVEAWLNVNMNMLRATIQALEVQSATLTALQTMGKNFETAMKTATAKPEPTHAEKPVARKQAPQPKAQEKAGNGTAAPKGAREKTAGGSGQQAGAGFTHPMANAAAWWNMLQNQFKQAVGDAMSDDVPPPAAKPGATATGSRKRKAPPRT